MKTLQEVLAELQALDTTSLENVTTALNQAVTDLQVIADAQNSGSTATVAPTLVSVTVTWSDQSTTVCVPQAN